MQQESTKDSTADKILEGGGALNQLRAKTKAQQAAAMNR